MTWSTPLVAVPLAAACVAIAAPPAAAITVSDCATAPVRTVGRTTVLDVRPDDLTLACQLTALPGTKRVRVRANAITITGPAGGIATTTKGRSIDVRAAASLVVSNASLDAGNANAKMLLRAGTGVDVSGSVLNVGDGNRLGRELKIDCRDPSCAANVALSTLQANRVRVLIGGPVSGTASTIRSSGPRDRIDVRSLTDAVAFCDVDLLGANEGRIFVAADLDVDLSDSELATGRFIEVVAGRSGTGDAILQRATLRNDFGKDGDVEVEAGGGANQVDILDAVLIDDDKPATVNDVSTINGREIAPHEGFNNTVGIPNTDT